MISLRERELTPLARGCVEALRLAGNADRLRAANGDELKIAAVLLARALDHAMQVTSSAGLRADAVRQLETAGQAIGAELRRRKICPSD